MKKPGKGLIITGAILSGLSFLSFINPSGGYDPSGLPGAAQEGYTYGYLGFMIVLFLVGLSLILLGIRRNKKSRSQ